MKKARKIYQKPELVNLSQVSEVSMATCGVGPKYKPYNK